ncbi:MAG: hypothetical protein IPM35_14525 [Myxococcales bacterium]|nr:hypothetical protein [Myxococcales bacterium]
MQGAGRILALDGAGRIVTASKAGTALRLGRLLQDGNADTSFGSLGYSWLTYVVDPLAVLMLPDGRALVVGVSKTPPTTRCSWGVSGCELQRQACGVSSKSSTLVFVVLQAITPGDTWNVCCVQSLAVPLPHKRRRASGSRYLSPDKR